MRDPIVLNESTRIGARYIPPGTYHAREAHDGSGVWLVHEAGIPGDIWFVPWDLVCALDCALVPDPARLGPQAKTRKPLRLAGLRSETAGIRTRDPLIKSPSPEQR